VSLGRKVERAARNLGGVGWRYVLGGCVDCLVLSGLKNPEQFGTAVWRGSDERAGVPSVDWDVRRAGSHRYIGGFAMSFLYLAMQWD
jgi:hypothetical protein